MLSRRDFTRSLAALPAAAAFAKVDSKIAGVQLGCQSYSFRDRSLDEAIQAMAEIGLGSCELWQGHVEPKGDRRNKDDREMLRKWRLTVGMDHFKQVRAKFDKAGIELYAYNYSFRDDFTDEEIARGFEMAKALGVKNLTASATVSAAKRVDPYAAKARVYVGMHGHANVKDPNEFATPETFERAMDGSSPYIAINLDLGHFVAAGFDPLPFMEKHAGKIVTLHVKDRKKNQGANVPFGEGDTPIKEVLQAMKAKRYKFPANIEYEYKGADSVVEVRRSFEYMKRALA